MEMCPCGLEQSYEDCCARVHADQSKALTAESLMRARYSAFVVKNYEFLKETLHEKSRSGYDEDSVRVWAEHSLWNGLKVIDQSKGGESDEEGSVEFEAYYTMQGARKTHHEHANFVRENNKWYYWDGEIIKAEPIRVEKIGRNEPCTCGSGKKYKKCCA